MFTGIITAKAQVQKIEKSGGLTRLTLAFSPNDAENLSLGASVAVSGVCLTVVSYEAGEKTLVSFDVMEETLKKTNLDAIAEGAEVNIERSLKMGDELGGHQVSGHVHGEAKVTAVEKTDGNVKVTLEIPGHFSKYIFPQGFIALNGASLTIASAKDNALTVALIPETLARTTFGAIAVDDRVNFEIDQQTRTIVDTLERLNSPSSPPSSS